MRTWRVPRSRGVSVVLATTSILILGILRAGATEVNITVDDQQSSNDSVLVYMPPLTWNQGNGCDFCAAKPNASFAIDGTWHDASYNPQNGDRPLEISVSFTGIAIYTYFILPDRNSPPTILAFTLDGANAGTFQHSLSNLSAFIYNAPAFTRTNLKNEAHTLIITTGGNTSSLVLFDYLIYTTQEKHRTSVGEIVGPVLGGLAAVIALVLCYQRRLRRSVPSREVGTISEVGDRYTPDPYVIQGDDIGHLAKGVISHQTVPLPILSEDTDYTARTELGSTRRSKRNVDTAPSQLSAIPPILTGHLPQTPMSNTSETGDALPRYESLSRNASK